MIRKILPLSLVLGAAAIVWAGSSAPRVGAIREPDGSIRPLFGLSSNFVVGEPLPFDRAQAAAFSDQAGLVLTKGRIELVSLAGRVVGSYATDEANPVLDIEDAPETAIACLPSTSRFVRWNGHAFIDSPFEASQLAGTIRAVRLLDSAHVELLVADGIALKRVTVAIADGVPVRTETLPEVGASAFQTDSFLLFHDASGLRVSGPDSATNAFPIAQTDLVFEKSGKNWLHISSAAAGRQWMLHLIRRNPTLSELPMAPVNPATAEVAR